MMKESHTETNGLSFLSRAKAESTNGLSCASDTCRTPHWPFPLWYSTLVHVIYSRGTLAELTDNQSSSMTMFTTVLYLWSWGYVFNLSTLCFNHSRRTGWREFLLHVIEWCPSSSCWILTVSFWVVGMDLEHAKTMQSTTPGWLYSYTILYRRMHTMVDDHHHHCSILLCVSWCSIELLQEKRILYVCRNIDSLEEV